MKKGRKYIEPMLGKGDKKGTNKPEKKGKTGVETIFVMTYHHYISVTMHLCVAVK